MGLASIPQCAMGGGLTILGDYFSGHCSRISAWRLQVGSRDSTGHQANSRVPSERYKRSDSAGPWGATLGFGQASGSSGTGAEQRSIIADLLAKQRDDGGFSMSDLVGAWKRKDNTRLDEASDGYATGLIALALEQIGDPLTKPKLDRAISWLRHSQDPSDGRWPASSLNKQRELSSDAGHFMSDAATAYAVMAIENFKSSRLDLDCVERDRGNNPNRG